MKTDLPVYGEKTNKVPKGSRRMRKNEASTEWQKIDTAPKGQRIVLYFPAVGRPSMAEMISIDLYPVCYHRKPTHWMPLPLAPQADEGQV